MINSSSILATFALLAFYGTGGICAEPSKSPNIIVILADDIGYGDLGCYGATRVKTPNLDRLAQRGLRFTDGYAASATCTPSRYALMTGQYAWRKKGTGILPGDAALIIEPGRFTLSEMFHRAGYVTGVVGKWHLGLGAGAIDWNTHIKPGPAEIGFDYSFIVPATGDRVPCVYVEDQRVANLDPKDPIQVSYGKSIGNEPTGAKNPELLKMKLSAGHDATIVNGISRIGFMTGGKSARWNDETMADDLTERAKGFITKNQKRPFFLYFATHDIHVPRVPHQRFVGSSECGVRGDAIHQLDACVGALLAHLEKHMLLDNTIIVFSSDNGPVVDDGYADGAVRDLNGHRPAGRLRGGKYSLFQGGTRVPFLVHWPAKIKPAESSAIVCQIDLLASFAALLGQELPGEVAPDSFNVLPALVGESAKGRSTLIHHAGGLAIRDERWSYIPANQKKKDGPMLFDLKNDIEEKTNVISQHPEVVRRLAEQLKTIQENGRSRP